MLPNSSVREVTIKDYLKVLQKRAGVILTFLAVIPTAVAVVDFNTKPVYLASVTLSVGKGSPKIVSFQQSYQDYWTIKEYYDTQFKILNSRLLAEKVFEELKLSKDSDYRNIADPAGKLRGQVRVDRPKDSSIVFVYVDDSDPLRASSIANAYAKVYIEYSAELREGSSKKAIAWLESQVNDIKKKLQQSEVALNKYIQENKIVAVPDIEKKTETLLQSLKQEKSRLEIERSEAAERYKAKHPKMIALKAQLENVDKKIDQETNNLLNLNQKMVQYNLLKKDVESNQQLYTNLLTRSKETDITDKIEEAPIKVIDNARPPTTPYKPKTKKDVLRAIGIALVLGIGFSLFLEYLDSTIRTSEDVSFYLGLPFLGYVPTVSKQEAGTDQARMLLCSSNPKSLITEAYRAIRTSLLFAFPEDKPLKTIMVTSSVPQEGKSFVITNLSQVFCQMNERIVLIDVDMRRPKVHKAFGFELKPGLSDFLTGNVSADAVIRKTSVPNLFVITAGTIPPNPSELLLSGKLHVLLDELKAKYDRILLDSPPILSVADTSVLSNIVDAVALVVRGASTRLEAGIKAKQKILESKGKIIGVIVNNIRPEKEDSYYYYHYYYADQDNKKNKA